MALLLVFGGVSKEYLHLFADHEDTVDCFHDSEGPHFENEHHHCDFLSFTLPPYVHDAAVYELPTQTEYFQLNTCTAVAHLIPRTVLASHQRGPPAYTV